MKKHKLRNARLPVINGREVTECMGKGFQEESHRCRALTVDWRKSDSSPGNARLGGLLMSTLNRRKDRD